MTEVFLRDVIDDSMAADASIGASIRTDLQAFRERDPACVRYSVPLLYFKGFHALQAYRIGHFLWCQGRSELALYLQSRVSEVFAVDIHPAAQIGFRYFARSCDGSRDRRNRRGRGSRLPFARSHSGWYWQGDWRSASKRSVPGS